MVPSSVFCISARAAACIAWYMLTTHSQRPFLTPWLESSICPFTHNSHSHHHYRFLSFDFSPKFHRRIFSFSIFILASSRPRIFTFNSFLHPLSLSSFRILLSTALQIFSYNG